MNEHIPYPDMVPILRNESITLRAPRIEDLPAIDEQSRDAATVEWTRVPSPYADGESESYLASIRDSAVDGSALTWAITIEDAYAGLISLRRQSFGSADVGYVMHPAHRGKGVMTAALRLVVDYAFDQAGVEVLTWTAGFGNWGSRRVAWACGFQFDGLNRNGWGNGRRRADEWHATILATDPRTPKAPWLMPPTIIGERVVLRDQRDSDAPRIVEACRDERTRHWLNALPENYSLADAESFIAAWRDHHSCGTQLNFGLADPETDAHIGVLSLIGNNIVGGQAEVGYWLHPDARGRGVMTEAVGIAVRHAFAPLQEGGLGIRRLFLRAAEANAASRHIAEANGFVEVGRERQSEILGDGSVVDLIYYDLLASQSPTPEEHA